ncbi:hypothetical protein [Aliikangiella sp. IMCC44359]|uniref:hypothetical protein n=1 Tax=Aliikangiella sp. IMCC44359 TaxID=3459125 RepID=UPI00403AA5F2
MKFKQVVWVGIFIGLIIVAGCSISEEIKDDKPIIIENLEMSEADKLACLNSGGTIKKACMAGIPTCIRTYQDAGKKCSSSKECQGICVTPVELSAGVKTEGVCSANNNPCGCFQEVDSGISQPFLCVD